MTSHVCKVLESIIKDVIWQHLDNNNIINDTQHGFRKGRSCLSNLLCFLNDVGSWVDDGNAVDAIYLDFRKAFDKMPHDRLLYKLKVIGVSGKVVDWIGNWLRGRKQRVVLNGVSSDWSSVLSGIPQVRFFGQFCL